MAGPQEPDGYSDLLQTIHCDAFVFSEGEQAALDLYDQLQELELQKSLLESQAEGTYFDDDIRHSLAD
jgi:hypothetical protein